MHHPEHRAEVQQGRKQCRLGHLHIGHVDGLGHDEGDRAHDRGHDLTAHARGGLHPTGKGGLVAEALHQRDGELPGGHHVGDPRAGDGTHQRRRHQRHLGRPAGTVTEQTHGKVGEQPYHPGLLEEGAEQNEQEDVGCRHVGGRPVEPLGTEGQLVDDLIQAVPPVRQVAGQVIAEQAVGQEQPADDRQGNAHDPPRGLEYQRYQHQTDDHVRRGQITGTLNQIGLEVPLIEEGRHAGQGQYPGQGLPGPVAATHRIDQVHQHQQKTDVPGPQHLSGNRVKRGGDDLVTGKCQGHIEQGPGPLGGARVEPLILAHGLPPAAGYCRMPASR